MPSYKLFYFDARARGETTRMLFKLGGQDFDDTRIAKEKWPEFKSKAPLGQLPVLWVDGVKICQSNAIERYVAREVGLAGKDSLAQAQVDMVIDTIVDASQNIGPLFQAKSDEEKAAAAKKFREETFEPGLEKVQKLLELNNEGKGYFVGDELTVADVKFLNVVDFFATIAGADLSKFPKLKALNERVASNPTIAKWIKERPVTPM